MAYERRDFSQTAVDTAISSGISSVDTTITIDATTGWPTGGANGPFFVMADYDIAGKELILVTSRTGNSLQNCVRAQGGTSASSHNAGARIRHIATERDSDEANYAVSQTVGNVTTKGDLLAATAANTLGRRSVGTNEQVLIADSAQATGMRWGLLGAANLDVDSVGASELANNSVDTGAIVAGAVTAAKIATNTITANEIAADAIGSSELADNAVDTNAIVNLAVTAAKIANDTITATQIAAGAIGASELANGAVAETADIADAIITLAKFASEAGTTYGGAGAGAVGPFNNLTLGTGGVTYARHFKLGRLVVVLAGFQLGTSGDLAGGALGIDLPFTCANVTGFSGNDAAIGGFSAARAFNNATQERVSGTGVVAASECLNFVSAFTSAVWNFASPFDWSDAGSGSKFQSVIIYEATA